MARQKLVHLHSSTIKVPAAADLNLGELAVQHASDEVALYTKKNDGSIAKFIDKAGVESLISGATESFIALKADVVEVEGEVSALTETVNAISGAVENIHTHENKSVLDGITSAKVENWDNAFASAHTHDNASVLDGISAEDVEAWDAATADSHTHANKALLDTYTQTEADLADAVSKAHEHSNASVLDGISAEDVEAWDGAVTALDDKVDKEEGKGLSTNDYTTAEKEKLASIAASADTNVIETVKVNGTALTVTDKAVDILVAEGTANGTVKVNGVDVSVHGLGSAAYQDTTAFDASGAAATAKSEVIGDATDSGNTLGKLEDRLEAVETGSNVSISTATTTEGYLKTYTFSQNGSEIGKIDIPKDLVVTSGQIVEVNDVKYLRLTIANQSEPVDIAVSDLVDVYTQGNGIEISTGNVISAKVVAGNGLSLDANGIAMAAASSNGAGAMSAADFDKLASVAASAQVNTVEGVQVNGADLTPDANKKVNVTVTSGTNNGTIAVNGSDVAVTGLGSAAFEDTDAFDEAGAAGAASAAAITAVVGDMTGDTKTLGALQDAIEGLDLGDENVIETVKVNGTALTVTDKAVDITLGSAAFEDTDAFDAAGAAGAASAAAITAVVGDASASGSTLGALEDRIDGLDLGEHNVLEGVQVNGTDLTIDGNKKVNIELGSAAFSAATDFEAAGAADAAAQSALTRANAYTDDAVANYVSAATGDTLVSASVSNNQVTVGATQNLQDAVTAANASVQGIATGKDSGASLDGDRKLDFSEFGIDCGEY